MDPNQSPLPIPMLLFCPVCATQHIDAPQPKKGWSNPSHRSHECQKCGHVWRPADVPTTGVAAIETKGQRDGDPRPKPSLSAQRSTALADDEQSGTVPEPHWLACPVCHEEGYVESTDIGGIDHHEAQRDEFVQPISCGHCGTGGRIRIAPDKRATVEWSDEVNAFSVPASEVEAS